MAQENSKEYTKLIREQIAKSANVLSKMAFASNSGARVTVTAENGQVEHKIQIPVLPVSKEASHDGPGTTSSADGLGTRLISDLNAIGKFTWNTVTLKQAKRKIIGFYFTQNELGQKIMTLNSSDTSSEGANKFDLILAENDEELIKEILTATATRKTVDFTKPEEVLKALKSALTRISVKNDQFKKGTSKDQVVAVLNPFTLDVLADVPSKYFIQGREVLDNGLPIEGRINGFPYITANAVNQVEGTDVSGTKNGLAYVVVDITGIKSIDPSSTEAQLEPITLLDNKVDAVSFHLSNTLLDATRAEVGEFTRTADTPLSDSITKAY